MSISVGRLKLLTTEVVVYYEVVVLVAGVPKSSIPKEYIC